MKALNNKFDILVAKYPFVLTLGQLVVVAMVVIAVIFTVNLIN